MDALMHDASCPGRTPSVTAELESSIVDKTLHDKPIAPIAATHWGTRRLAEQLWVGPTTIRRVWQLAGVNHLVRRVASR